jgi:catalase
VCYLLTSCRNFTADEAAKISGDNDAWSTKELFDTIESGDYPSWTVGIATMTEEEAANYRYDILDLTKDWLNVTYHEVRVISPTRTHENHH